MLPIGAGEPRAVTHDAINHRAAPWSPDGRAIIFVGNEAGRPARTWLQAIDGGAARALTPEGVAGRVITPDGKQLLAAGLDRRFALYSVDRAAAPPIPLSALRASDVPMRFADDGTLFVATFGKIPALLYRVNLKTGARTVAREAMPADPAGLTNVGPIFTTGDGKTFVYSYTRMLSDLYLVEAR
jgi:Tol biopolymer transport system component